MNNEALHQKVQALEAAMHAVIVAFGMIKTDSPAVSALKSSLRAAPSGLEDGEAKDMLMRFYALLDRHNQQ